jgi:hypothetical protein
MNDRYKRILFTTPLLLILLLIFANSPARAASGNPIYATIQYVQNAISTALSPLQSSLLGLSNRVTNLEATVTPIPSEISDLQKRVSVLETQAPLPTPTPFDFVFFSNQLIPTHGSVDSQTFDAKGYSKVAFSYQCTQQGAQITLFVSPDQINAAPQFTANSDQCHQGGSVTLDTAGRYYTVEVGFDPNIINPPPTVSAFGHFFN